MKKYLMTWYGITDFRASLGLEHTTGPVLGALLAEDYTDVVILGFTNLDKSKLNESNEKYTFQEKLEEIENTDPAATTQFINLFSNTKEAHISFVQWLKKQLIVAGKKVVIHFHPVELKHLNDTEGIYEAATQSLNSVSIEEGEKLVTLYLSPGTPVMAFVWAFAALGHPNLKKRLIASSQPERPPETIVLPNEWLEWHGKQIKTSKGYSEQYDIVFHLFGEQRLPNLLGVMQFSSKKHVFVNSKQFPADVMKQFIGDAEYGEIIIDPYDPENVRTTILDMIAKMPSNIHIGFNLTGGTKLMYAGALAACRKVNATPFYFNGRSNKVIFLNDFLSEPINEITNVEHFLNLNGDGLKISKSGKVDWENELENRKIQASKVIWNNRSKINKQYKELLNYTTTPRPFIIRDNNFFASLDENANARLTIDNNSFIFENFPEFAKYLVGGWFEVYVLGLLSPFVEEGSIKDIRMNLEISIKDPENNENYRYFDGERKEQVTYQEFDIIFTDGFRLFIVECKSGKVTSDHIIKLHEIISKYGGVEGFGLLVSTFNPSHPIFKQKADDLRNVEWIFGHKLQSLLNDTINKEMVAK
jgi:hypothetical protein